MVWYHTIWYKIKKGEIMKVIVIGGEKGGTGKTTIATNLAALRAINGVDTLFVDTDRQGSASSWAFIRDSNNITPRVPCIQKFGMGLSKELADLSAKYESIIVDAGGRDSVELRAAMVIADLLIVPLQASQFDLWTLGKMEELYKQVSPINPNLKVKILLSRAPTNPSMTDILDAQRLLADYVDFEMAESIISDRAVYRRAAAEGLSVIEQAQKNTKAVHEIRKLYSEIYGDKK